MDRFFYDLCFDNRWNTHSLINELQPQIRNVIKSNGWINNSYLSVDWPWSESFLFCFKLENNECREQRIAFYKLHIISIRFYYFRWFHLYPFTLQKSFVIHHLMDTDDANDYYYHHCTMYILYIYWYICIFIYVLWCNRNARHLANIHQTITDTWTSDSNDKNVCLQCSFYYVAVDCSCIPAYAVRSMMIYCSTFSTINFSGLFSLWHTIADMFVI